MAPETPDFSPRRDRGRACRRVTSGTELIIEASGPTLADCLAVTVECLIRSFADTSDVAATDPIPIAVGPNRPELMLDQLVEEAVNLVEVFDRVPASVELADTEGGGVAGFFDAAPAKAVRLTTPPPRAVAVRRARFRSSPAGWSCEATIAR